MCYSQEDRGDYFGFNSGLLFVRMLYAYRVHIVFTDAHFMHLQISYLWISHLNYRSVKDLSLLLFVPGHYTAVACVLLRLSFIGEG